MRILLTNDDGIYAPGIAAMFDALVDHPVQGRARHGGPLTDPTPGVSGSPQAVVFPVAPSAVESATSHGVTFHVPLMVSEERVNERMMGIAIEGRPADCVKVAIANLWPDRFGEGSKPDLLISGMNGGANCGINIIYSGTVAAALEAAFLGIPSIAVSMLVGEGASNFQLGAFWARKAIEKVIAKGLPRPRECLSINLPATDDPALSLDSQVPPIRVCPMNAHGLVDRYERRLSPLKREYYWASGHGLEFRATDAGSDVELLRQGYITVTPLKFDLTDHAALDQWRQRVEQR